MQVVTRVLKNECGFAEDRGGSCTRESAGTFKTQHDTGKNVFTVVVFPKVEEDGGGTRDGEEENSSGDNRTRQYPLELPLTEGTPEHTVLLASEDTFRNMVDSSSSSSSSGICPSWTEKKTCQQLLQNALDTLRIMDELLLRGTPLSDPDQEFYDAVGGTPAVQSKHDHLKRCMQGHVEEGKLTPSERQKLLQQVEERIHHLHDEWQKALSQSREKKAQVLKLQLEKAKTRQSAIEAHPARSPLELYPLKYQSQIQSLRKKLQPLKKLEQSAKGRLLTVKETKELSAIDEIEEEIREWERKSRGWFEGEEEFETRVELARAKFASSSSSSAKGGKSSGNGSAAKTTGKKGNAGMTTNWLTPGGLAAKQAALGKKAAASKTKKTNGGGGVFAAMMLDSDSDSD